MKTSKEVKALVDVHKKMKETTSDNKEVRLELCSAHRGITKHAEIGVRFEVIHYASGSLAVIVETYGQSALVPQGSIADLRDFLDHHFPVEEGEDDMAECEDNTEPEDDENYIGVCPNCGKETEFQPLSEEVDMCMSCTHTQLKGVYGL